MDRMLAHRFVEDVCADRLPREAFDRYLVCEGAFVETAIGIFAFATARAPDLAARRALIEVQAALAGPQMRYFEDVAARRGLDLAAPLPPGAARFRDAMASLAARAPFLDIVAAMFAAEWMYLGWCTRAAATPSADPNLAEWVALHAAPGFRAQAEWLGDALDAAAEEEDLPRFGKIVANVTEWEIAFHDAPYADAPA
jgi:thiaminase/transcriptional activator TenA